MRQKSHFEFMLIVLTLLACIFTFPGCGPEVAETFDFRHPQPVDYPNERTSGSTEIQFSSFGYDGSFPYDLEARFGADKADCFVVEEVLANGRPVEKYRVYNNSISNFLRRVNGVENFSVRFLSRWQVNQDIAVELIGTTPAGEQVKLAVSGKAPAQRTTSSLGFQYPGPAFAYFHIHCTFLPESYKPFTIKSVKVNGERVPAIDLRILKGRKGGYGRPEQVRAMEANDGIIPDNEGFSVDFAYHWKAGDEIKVVVSGETKSGETQELTASGKASWDSTGLKGWEHSASLVVRETAGVDRQGEPVEVTLGLIGSRVTDPRRELRVVTRIPGHPDADSSGFVEVPSQVLNVTVWDDSEMPVEIDAKTAERIRRYIPTTTVQLVFLACMQSYEERVYLLCYGNPDANAPVYKTDLKVEGEGLGQTVSTARYRIGLSANSSAVETVLLRGEPDVLLEHKLETNGAIHWNPGVYSPPEPWVHASDWEEPNLAIQTGPVVHRISRYENLPFVTHTAAQVVYQFFGGQPYMLCESVMEVKKDIFVQALRNAEIVFNHAVFDEFVWKDELGKIQSLDLSTTRKHPIHALEIPADTAWFAFISRKHGVGFASITIEYNNFNLYGSLSSVAQPYFYVQVGPWYYCARPLVYPFGHANFSRMMPVRKGSVYTEVNAYLPFHLADGPAPFAEVEKYQKILTNPLKVSEHIAQDPDTPKYWIEPLLVAPFDEGVEGARDTETVPDK